jgi:hypothetical protein
VPLLLAGCASSQAATSSGRSPAASSAPPATAAMICGDDIEKKIQQALALPAPPATRSTWAKSVFTCTYSLPAGPLTLSVHVLPDGMQARRELDAGQAGTPGSSPLAGLGERAWATPDGRAVVLKDAQVLTVDATHLPEVFGASGQKRTDLAYEVASDVMGCWTGDGDE